jgi:predicted amidophosphoribosyltransferase
MTNIGRDSMTELKVISSVIYSSVAQKIILGAKESHLKKCDELLVGALTHSLGKFLSQSSADFLVPIPSRKSAVRLRGRQFVAEIAEAGSQIYGIPIATPLRHHRAVKDQSGLHLEARWNNLERAFVVERDHGLRGRVLLIDDLVTTGATLCEAARALRYAGIEVVGAVTAALAQPLR